jgi:hypothetical protein
MQDAAQASLEVRPAVGVLPRVLGYHREGPHSSVERQVPEVAGVLSEEGMRKSKRARISPTDALLPQALRGMGKPQYERTGVCEKCRQNLYARQPGGLAPRHEDGTPICRRNHK